MNGEERLERYLKKQVDKSYGFSTRWIKFIPDDVREFFGYALLLRTKELAKQKPEIFKNIELAGEILENRKQTHISDVARQYRVNDVYQRYSSDEVYKKVDELDKQCLAGMVLAHEVQARIKLRELGEEEYNFIKNNSAEIILRDWPEKYCRYPKKMVES